MIRLSFRRSRAERKTVGVGLAETARRSASSYAAGVAPTAARFYEAVFDHAGRRRIFRSHSPGAIGTNFRDAALAYSVYLNLLSPRVRETAGRKAEHTMRAFTRLMFLDLELAVAAYLDSST